jgi:hypothetical protein
MHGEQQSCVVSDDIVDIAATRSTEPALKPLFTVFLGLVEADLACEMGDRWNKNHGKRNECAKGQSRLSESRQCSKI